MFKFINKYVFFLIYNDRRRVFNFILVFGFIAFSLPFKTFGGPKHKVGPKLYSIIDGICCPPDLPSSLHSLTWSSIDTIINDTPFPITNFRLYNAVNLPPGFPYPQQVYVTEINTYQKDTFEIDGKKIKFNLNNDIAIIANNLAIGPFPVNNQWVGYESNKFNLPVGTHIYRLVYVWDSSSALPCRYFSGRQWNGDNTISLATLTDGATTIFEPSSPQGILMLKRNAICNSINGGSVTAIPKCSTPPLFPIFPAKPNYILLGGTIPDTNSNGNFDNLNPGNYSLYLIDSLTNSMIDSSLFSISLEPKIHIDTVVIACNSFTWDGVTYTASGVYSNTASGTFNGNSCNVLSFIDLTILPLPSISIAGSSGTIIIGESTTLNAIGANTYTWMPGSFSGSSINVSPTVTTTYTVTGITNEGCINTSTKTITVYPSPNGTAGEISIKNIVQTSPNTFEYEVYFTNTGTTSMALRGYSWGLNLTNGIENGGILTHSFVSRDTIFNALSEVNVSYSTLTNQLRATTTNAILGNEVWLDSGIAYRIATMRVATSASSFPIDFNPFLPPLPLSPLQVVTSAGRTQCIISVVIGPGAIYSLYGVNNQPRDFSLNVLTEAIDPLPTGALPFILNPTNSILNLTCFIQGYFNGTNGMVPVLANQNEISTATACDSIDIELHNDSTFTLSHSQRVILNQNGQASAIFNSVLPSLYYIVVKHRNTIETWSAIPVPIGATSFYDFTDDSLKAYGGNQKQLIPGVQIYGFYSGDVTKDNGESIDLLDLNEIFLDLNNFSSGYLSTDLNGDGSIDLLDITPLEDNLAEFIFSHHP